MLHTYIGARIESWSIELPSIVSGRKWVEKVVGHDHSEAPRIANCHSVKTTMLFISCGCVDVVDTLDENTEKSLYYDGHGHKKRPWAAVDVHDSCRTRSFLGGELSSWQASQSVSQVRLYLLLSP